MSTLKATTLSNLAGSQTVPMDTVAQGSAKAWVNFNGTGTVAIRRAFNVSSITDLGVGSYQINYSTLMPDTNYAGELSTSSNASGGINASYLDTPTTSSVLAYTYGVAGGGAGAFRDTANVFVAIFS